MTDAEKNTVIAEAISPEREGRLWKDCEPCCGHGKVWEGSFQGSSANPVPTKSCPDCHGTGRVPVELHTPPYALLVVEWAAMEEWWHSKATGEWERGDWEWSDWADSIFYMLIEGDKFAGHTASLMRDLVHAGIEASKGKRG